MMDVNGMKLMMIKGVRNMVNIDKTKGIQPTAGSTNAPTSAPTAGPTSAPTSAPTEIPTAAPLLPRLRLHIRRHCLYGPLPRLPIRNSRL
mmetsp:Transcript_5348/g.8223  ORF Transcript_5348/g.8223 Transcript_5348/m.8223 type:complete len:90 (-) Transcript_5348:186-455(-)